MPDVTGKARESLSVVMPAYNARNYIRDALGSIKRQNWPGKLQIIVIDDGSSDGTVCSIQDQGYDIIIKEHAGAASARNTGIKSATGDLLFFLDADDMLTDDALENLYLALSAEQGLAAVFGMTMDFISPELKDSEKAKLGPRIGPYKGILPGCALFRRNSFLNIGLFDEKLMGGETVAWLMKFRASGLLYQDLDVVTLRRRLHMSNTGRLRKNDEMKGYAAAIRERMRVKA